MLCRVVAAATHSLASNLGRVRARIAAAAARSGREARGVTLVGVTKSVGPEEARALFALGLEDLGENRVQELERKAKALGPGPRWHLVGPLQRNKARPASEIACLIHSADSLRLLETLDRIAAERGEPVRVLLEVNVSGEATKHGFPAAECLSALREARPMQGIRIEGLMTMPPPAQDPETVRPHFRRLRELRDAAIAEALLPPKAALSMGMTQDFEVAIEEGATIVRIGTALFTPG